MTIRPATVNDLSDLCRLAADFVAASPYRHVFVLDPESVARTATRMIEHEDGVVLVCQGAGGEVFGMLALFAYDHPLSGERMVTEIAWWVEPGRRGTAGLRLLQKGEQWAQDHGAAGIQMVAPDARVGAFYERVGYRAVETAYMRRF